MPSPEEVIKFLEKTKAEDESKFNQYLEYYKKDYPDFFNNQIKPKFLTNEESEKKEEVINDDDINSKKDELINDLENSTETPIIKSEEPSDSLIEDDLDNSNNVVDSSLNKDNIVQSNEQDQQIEQKSNEEDFLTKTKQEVVNNENSVKNSVPLTSENVNESKDNVSINNINNNSKPLEEKIVEKPVEHEEKVEPVKKSKKKLFIGLGIAVTVIIIGIVVIVLLT